MDQRSRHLNKTCTHTYQHNVTIKTYAPKPYKYSRRITTYNAYQLYVHVHDMYMYYDIYMYNDMVYMYMYYYYYYS